MEVGNVENVAEVICGWSLVFLAVGGRPAAAAEEAAEALAEGPALPLDRLPLHLEAVLAALPVGQRRHQLLPEAAHVVVRPPGGRSINDRNLTTTLPSDILMST